MNLKNHIKFFIISIVVLFTIIFHIYPILTDNLRANSVLLVAISMAVLWISEAIPFGATSLIPIILFPLLDVMSSNDVAMEYMNDIILLFIGGFLISIAMEQWNLHKRISLKILSVLGSSYSKILLGFILSTALLSMFISNTATALMMLPIGLAVNKKITEFFDENSAKKFSLSIMLAIAFSCSIGGIATLIGTPPNLVFKKIYEINFPDAQEITFGNWMLFAFPITFFLLFILWLTFAKIFFKIENQTKLYTVFFKKQYIELGRISYEEKIILFVFVMTALLWIFRKDINLGVIIIPGWSNLSSLFNKINDTTISIFSAILLFIIPSKFNRRILNKESFSKIPWEIILLFGGGFALAKAFSVSGLALIIANNLKVLSIVHPILIVFMVAFIMVLLTELTSNTATAQTVLPILASLSLAINIHPLMVMVPATLSVSFAFMLPVATPPNAIVFSSGYIKISEMVKYGFIIDLIAILLTTLYSYFFIEKILG